MYEARQSMTLNKEGQLLTSCDSLFSTEDLVGEKLIEHFPFLESVFSDLLEQLELGRLIHFPKVETKHPFLTGFYDYTFRIIRIQKDGWGVQWDIVDATEQYQVLKSKQQSDHEKKLRP